MTRRSYPVTERFGVLEAWHYGDGVLYVFPMNQNVEGCKSGTATIGKANVKRLIAFLQDMQPKRRKA